MREIKFRLRVGNRIVGFEKWYPGAGLAALPRWLYSKDGKYWNPDHVFHDSKDQFTGLKDKNGKEIYEGDIVKTSRSTFRVFWENAQFKAQDLLTKKWAYSPEGLYSIGVQWEVIGNIYENPELVTP